MKDLNEADPVALLRENVARPFERARAMPPEVYTLGASSRPSSSTSSPRVALRRPGERAGRARRLRRLGDRRPAGRRGARPRRAAARFSNVCLHRMSTLLHGRGRVRAIVCPYHAWTYNLDGTLRGAPAMTRNEAFDRKDYRLPELRCEEWLGWVFVTLNPDARAGRRAARRGRGAGRRLRHGGLRRDLLRDATSGTRTGRCSPRTSWRATTCPSATRRRSAVCRSSTRWSARRG